MAVTSLLALLVLSLDSPAFSTPYHDSSTNEWQGNNAMLGLSHQQTDLALWTEVLMGLTLIKEAQHWRPVHNDDGVRMETCRCASGAFAVRGQAVLRASCERALELLREEVKNARCCDVQALPLAGYRVALAFDEKPARAQCLLTPVTDQHARLLWELQCDVATEADSVVKEQTAVEQCRDAVLRLRSQARQQRRVRAREAVTDKAAGGA